MLGMEPIVDVPCSCVAMTKDVYNSLWYEGFQEAYGEFQDAVVELRVSVPVRRIWCV